MREQLPFPYERYETLAEPLTVYYPAGQQEQARWVFQTIEQAGKQFATLLGQPMPPIDMLLVAPDDWELAPREESEEPGKPNAYWTDTTNPPCLVIPLELDPIFGEQTQEKRAFFLFHELVLAFLEDDPRPWPEEYPLWADEWQLKFAALWLSQQISGHQGMVNQDLRELYAAIFEPEPDGKTPVTVRGFDWYEDTTPEDYLMYELLLEQFAADLLANYGPQVLPRFLTLYRTDRSVLLSDEVTTILTEALGPGSAAWLEALVYF
ncbi:MAG TPA: hypothetical protein VFQ30_00050 [Ktedonobacteraceae bacterium]|nr:hypothetical protein [Ktedonobacteraceae bacterium]